MRKVDENKKSSIIVLVGCSGSGKTTIAEHLVNQYNVEKLCTTTTRAPREGEINGVHYNFIKKEDFNCESFLEYTLYAGNYYGTSVDTINNIITNGRNAVIVMDINGAQALKEKYPEYIFDIYIERPEQEIILSILERDVPNTEKALRIAQLKKDYGAKALCSYCIDTGTVDERVADIAKIANLQRK